jgi:hypothetical protein
MALLSELDDAIPILDIGNPMVADEECGPAEADGNDIHPGSDGPGELGVASLS